MKNEKRKQANLPGSCVHVVKGKFTRKFSVDDNLKFHVKLHAVAATDIVVHKEVN